MIVLPAPMNSEQIIGGRLADAFAARGFSEPGVAALRDAANVSLRTLYRHFPSREAMVVGALDARHEAYHAWLNHHVPDKMGDGAIRHVFERLAAWMTDRAPTGCLFVQAQAAHPDSTAIVEAVRRHKADTRRLLAERCLTSGRDDPALPERLFVLHEGQTAASVTTDPRAARDTTLALLQTLLDAGDPR